MAKMNLPTAFFLRLSTHAHSLRHKLHFAAHTPLQSGYMVITQKSHIDFVSSDFASTTTSTM